MLKTAEKLRTGFTLTELLVTIAVIIIVAGMAVASVTPFLKGRALSSGVRRVQSVVWRARALAATRRTNAYIAFKIDPAGGSQAMAVFRDEQNALEYADPSTPDPADDPVSQPQELPKNVQFLVPDQGITPPAPVFVPERDPEGYIVVDPDPHLATGAPAPRSTLVFHPAGGLHPAEMGGSSANWTVILEDQNGQRKAVTIFFATGLTRTTDL